MHRLLGTQRLQPTPPHLIRQLLVELLNDRIVEFLLEVPGRNPHGVDHLHQHEHGGYYYWMQRAMNYDLLESTNHEGNTFKAILDFMC